jgi:hypothetical protein
LRNCGYKGAYERFELHSELLLYGALIVSAKFFESGSEKYCSRILLPALFLLLKQIERHGQERIAHQELVFSVEPISQGISRHVT